MNVIRECEENSGGAIDDCHINAPENLRGDYRNRKG